LKGNEILITQNLRNMKLFEINPAKMLVRFYLMVFTILAAGFSGQWWIAGLGFLIFYSAVMGMQFRNNKGKGSGQTGKRIKLPTRGGYKHAV
jgi:hypothetical protein